MMYHEFQVSCITELILSKGFGYCRTGILRIHSARSLVHNAMARAQGSEAVLGDQLTWHVTNFQLIDHMGVTSEVPFLNTRTGGGHILPSPSVFRKELTNGGAQRRQIWHTCAQFENTPCVQILTS